MKKDLETEFKQTEKGHELIQRLNRVRICGILGLILSTGIIIFNAITKAKIWEYTSSVALIIASIVFLVESNKLRVRALQKFANEKNKTKRK